MKLRKLFAAGLALVMTLAMAAPTMAATITVDKAVTGQTYTAYKIFDVTEAKDAENKTIGYSYTADQAMYNLLYDAEGNSKVTGVTLTATAVAGTYNVSMTDGTAANALAIFLNNNVASLTKVKEVTAADEKAVISDLDAGYYFVDSSLGSVCMLNTTDATTNITEKNSEPTIVKKIVTAAGEVDETTATIGDTVNYKITVTKGNGIDKSITVHDKMEAGLTLKEDSIKVDGAAHAYAAPTDGCTFEVVLTEADFAAKDAIVITYSATLNTTAEIFGATNDNTAWLTYGTYTSAPSPVKVESYKASFIKVDGTTKAALEGVTFKLTDNAGTEIKLVDLGNGVYRVAMATETPAANITTPANGVIEIQGLGNGTYKLVELSTLTGYNLLAGPVEFKIENANNLHSLNVEGVTDKNVIENNMGTLLPSTGGMGTTLFYIVGGLMVVCAGVVLVTKKRMGNK